MNPAREILELAYQARANYLMFDKLEDRHQATVYSSQYGAYLKAYAVIEGMDLLHASNALYDLIEEKEVGVLSPVRSFDEEVSVRDAMNLELINNLRKSRGQEPLIKPK